MDFKKEVITVLKQIAFVVGSSACVAAFAAAADTPINVEKWPDDIPCKALKKNADCSYEITVPFTRLFQLHNGAKYKNTRETDFWDKKMQGADAIDFNRLLVE